MAQVLLTQKRSAGRLALCKAALAALTAAVLTAVIQLFELAYCAVRFGLPHGDYLLRSLVSYGSSVKALTLWQAFWLQFALKALGGIYAAVIVLTLSVLLRKFALTLTAGIAILPLPFLTVTDPHVLLRLPGPWALMLGGIYLDPSGSYSVGGRITEVRELDLSALGVYAAVILGLIALLLWYIRRRNTNVYLKGRRRRVAALAAVALCVGILAGCARKEAQELTYNSWGNEVYEYNDRVVISLPGLPLTLIDRQSGMSWELPMDAHTGVTASASIYFYGDGGTLYYFTTSTLYPRAGSNLQMSHVSLAALDLDTLTESVLYSWDADTDWFFGLLDRPSVDYYAGYISEYFVSGGHLCYVDPFDHSSFYRMSLMTGQSELLIDDLSVNFSSDGERIFYTDNYSRLVIYDIAVREGRSVDEVVVSSMALTDRGLYFLNLRDGGALYHWDEAAGKVRKVSDVTGSSIYWDENYLWVNGRDGGLYRCGYDGGELSSVTVPENTYTFIPTSGDVFYFYDYMENTLLQVDKTTLLIQILS